MWVQRVPASNSVRRAMVWTAVLPVRQGYQLLRLSAGPFAAARRCPAHSPQREGVRDAKGPGDRIGASAAWSRFGERESGRARALTPC
jgi:hypothetical protein